VTELNKTTYVLPPVLGTPQPLDSGLDLPFHQGLREHRVVLQRCASCRGWQWPPEVICHRCHGFDLAWEEPASLTGEIYTWTRVWHAARAGLEQSVPYVVLVVELAAADGFRLVGNLVGDALQEVRAGMHVEPVFEDHDEVTTPYTLLQWRLV
jgi:uncharacterized OB-fold protein